MAEESRTMKFSSESASFYGWKYSHYFAIVEESDKTLQARCTLCPAAKKPSFTAHNTTSNLNKHLEAVHKTTKLEAKDHGGESRKQKRESDDVGEPSQQKKQRVILNRSLPSPTTVCNLVSEYVVEDVLSLFTVESPAFRKLIGGISSAQVPDQKSFTQHLDKAYEEMERKSRKLWKTLIQHPLQQMCGLHTTIVISGWPCIGLIQLASVIAKLQFVTPGLLADIYV